MTTSVSYRASYIIQTYFWCWFKIIMHETMYGGRGSLAKRTRPISSPGFSSKQNRKSKKSLHLDQRDCCNLHVHASFQRWKSAISKISEWQTHTQKDKQLTICNPRACALRVNYHCWSVATCTFVPHVLCIRSSASDLLTPRQSHHCISRCGCLSTEHPL